MIHGLEEELERSRLIQQGKLPRPSVEGADEFFEDLVAKGKAAETPAAPVEPRVVACSECKKVCPEKPLTCARCKRAHYCTKACQVSAWKSGHRRICKPATAFDVGQRLILKGLTSNTDLNGKVVIVKGPSKQQAGGERWMVEEIETKKRIAVRPANLMKYWNPNDAPPDTRTKLSPEEALGRLSGFMETLPPAPKRAAGTSSD